MAEQKRPGSRLEEGLRNTEIKRETDVHNSLGPESDREPDRSRNTPPDRERMRGGDDTLVDLEEEE